MKFHGDFRFTLDTGPHNTGISFLALRLLRVHTHQPPNEHFPAPQILAFISEIPAFVNIVNFVNVFRCQGQERPGVRLKGSIIPSYGGNLNKVHNVHQVHGAKSLDQPVSLSLPSSFTEMPFFRISA